MSLLDYKRKRNFSKTSEPPGTSKSTVHKPEGLFVIQKHAARHLHYDFRLELGGTLKSWAVPKGPSLNPADKRLAVHVEDHPMDYADFEGIIPPRQYGAGTVMVWDRGHWIPDGDPKAAYEKGHLKFTLAGEKLQGRWTLVRMGGTRNRDEHNWLLIKEREKTTQTVVSADSTLAVATSVKSGMTMNQIATARPAEWHSDRAPSRSTTPTQPAKTKLPSADQRGSRTEVNRGSDMTPCPHRNWPRWSMEFQKVMNGSMS